MYLQNKYTKIYNAIIANAQARVKPEIYTETHHIIPKSLGGEDTDENLVVLTAREHFICHWLLMKMCEGKQKRKMARAFNSMVGRENARQYRYTPKSARLYQLVRQECNENMKGKKHSKESIELMKKNRGVKGVVGENNPMFGKKHSEETRKIQSEKAKKRRYSKETNEKRAAALRGRKRPTRPCPHCKKDIAVNVYPRWHGDNCKLNT